MKGSLAEGVLPGVLRDLYVGRRNGLLHFLRDDERRSVRFRHGHIINADTNVARERLGETLVRLGQLSQQDLDRASAIMIRDRKRLGAVLAGLGIMDLGRVEDALALQVREVLLVVMAWSEGEYAFAEEDPHAAPQGEITLKLSTGEMILEAVRRIEDPDVIRYALGDIDRVLALSSDPLLRFQRIALSPTDGFVLSRVDSTLSVREIIQMSPLDPAETQKSLFGLLCTGVIEPVAGVTKPRPQPGAGRSPARATVRAEPPPPPPTSRPAAPWSSGRLQPLASDEPGAAPSSAPGPDPTLPASPDEPAAPVASATQPASPAIPFDPQKQKEVEERRREIGEAYRDLKAQSHFELLGVPRAANEAQIKEAYFRLARRFHPDAHHDPTLADLREKLEAVFIRLGEAYEVLRNPRTRGNYEASLPRQAPGPGSVAHCEPELSAPPPDHDYEVRMATESAARAEKHIAEARYWDAIQLLEPAVALLDGKPRQRARVNLARCFAKNPNWVKRAEELLQLVVQEDPKNADAYFELGMIYKGGGLKGRSLSVFRKALEIRPEHEGARQELLALGPDKDDPEPPAGGGLLKKLFGKQ